MPPSGKIISSRPIPAFDTELRSLRGEKWIDIPGYEDVYRVSNHGRVKSLARITTIYYPTRGSYIERPIRERILKQKINKRYNQIAKDYRYECIVRLFDDYGEKTQIVHRLVFSAFKKRLSYDGDGLWVSHKDGNGLNNRLSNLVSGHQSDALKRAYKNKRHISPFALKSKRERERISQKSAQSRKKAVIQLTLNGKTIRQFDSIKEASHITCIADSNIIEVLKKRTKQAGGYKWEYANTDAHQYKMQSPSFSSWHFHSKGDKP